MTFKTKILAALLLLLPLALTVGAGSASALTQMVDSEGWIISLVTVKSNSRAIYYQGTIYDPDNDNDWEIAGCYRKGAHELSLTVRNYGSWTNRGLLTYQLRRTGQETLTGFWWQHFEDDEDYMRSGRESITILINTGDLPSYTPPAESGDGP